MHIAQKISARFRERIQPVFRQKLELNFIVRQFKNKMRAAAGVDSHQPPSAARRVGFQGWVAFICHPNSFFLRLCICLHI